MSLVCSVPYCKKVSRPLHEFPSGEDDLPRYNKWLEAILSPELFLEERAAVLQRRRVCSRHFGAEQWTTSNDGSQKLKPSAVPDMFLDEFLSSSSSKWTMIETGFLQAIFKFLKKETQEKTGLDRCAILTWGEIPLSPKLVYDKEADMMIGFEDLGGRQRTSRMAKTALSFMVVGANAEWAVPVGYFFIDKLKKDVLVNKIKECILTLKRCHVDLVATACVYDTTYVNAVESLMPYLAEKGLVHVYDVQSILGQVYAHHAKHDAEFVKDGRAFTVTTKDFNAYQSECNAASGAAAKRGLSWNEIVNEMTLRVVHMMSIGERMPGVYDEAMFEYLAVLNEMTTRWMGEPTAESPAESDEDKVTPKTPHLENWARDLEFVRKIAFKTSVVSVRPAFLDCLAKNLEAAPLLAKNLLGRGIKSFKMSHFCPQSQKYMEAIHDGDDAVRTAFTFRYAYSLFNMCLLNE